MVKLSFCAEIFFRVFLIFALFFIATAGWVLNNHHYEFVVKREVYTRLCRTKSILTVNGKFPGPTIYAFKGESFIVDVINQSDENITLHWHGVKEPRNPWQDGPAYITQCPIQPNTRFRYKVKLSTEEGTVWWHAHSTWARATVHGAIVVYPPPHSPYPFPTPHADFLLILGQWWNVDIESIYRQVKAGIAETPSNAYTINGQPGILYNPPCDFNGTTRLVVEPGKTYLLRLVNAAMTNGHFFAVEGHTLTVVGSDGSYLKPFRTRYIVISPGETMEVLLHANKNPDKTYLIAAGPFAYLPPAALDNSTTSAFLQYNNGHRTSSISGNLTVPSLPRYNDTNAFVTFTRKLRSLNSPEHPVNVPETITQRMLIAVAVNQRNSTILASSMNNISFQLPSIDILEAYYYGINGVYQPDFPDQPPVFYNFTAEPQPYPYLAPRNGTRVKMLEYNDDVEIILQGTSLSAPESHPIHLHGFSFYVVGWGFGNFDYRRDSRRFNLVDPPLKNTVNLPVDGWSALRFRAANPGVWFMHCHYEQHLTWGMNTVFIVKNGAGPEDQMLPPPRYMPPC